MLGDDGTGALWEHWHGRESRCHAWSATPVYDLSREVLGVRPADGRYVVAPATCGLTWAEGRYPTPHGDIAVAWRVEDGCFKIALEAPVEIDLLMPSGDRTKVPAGRRSFDCPAPGEGLSGAQSSSWRV
jgi:hypothetical protein